MIFLRVRVFSLVFNINRYDTIRSSSLHLGKSYVYLEVHFDDCQRIVEDNFFQHFFFFKR